MINLSKITGFDWNNGNIYKNWLKHKIKAEECEQIFFHKPLIINFDSKHSNSENRYYTLGKTDSFKLIFTVFTIRKNKIRIISARSMNKKERKIYGKQ